VSRQGGGAPAGAGTDAAARTSPPKVGVVILNYNGKLLAERCVRSARDAEYANKEIILVDNGSTDGSAPYLRMLFPDLVILEYPQNLGIVGGRNRGLREAVRRGGDYVLCLDNDARIETASIRELIAVAESDPRIGVVGPKVYSDEQSSRIQCAGGMIPYTQNVSSERGTGKVDRGQYDKIEDVDYFPGCGFMTRREVLETLDFLDESFHGLGYEDTDFCMRAVRAGYRVVYVPRAVMWHLGSATVGRYSAHKKYAEAVNAVYLVRRYGTFAQRVKFAFFAGFGLGYALIVQSVRGNHRAVFAKARGLWDGLRAPRRRGDRSDAPYAPGR
jgi:GT2 family glycosyltransferase